MPEPGEAAEAAALTAAVPIAALAAADPCCFLSQLLAAFAVLLFLLLLLFSVLVAFCALSSVKQAKLPYTRAYTLRECPNAFFWVEMNSRLSLTFFFLVVVGLLGDKSLSV